MEKAKNAGISLYPGEIERLRERSMIRDGGSPTRYVRRLFESDMAGEPIPTAYDDQILVKLATTYAGYLAPRMATATARLHVDQPHALHLILGAVLEHLARGYDLVDFVVCPRSEWHPEPMQAVAEAPAAYPTAPADPAAAAASDPVGQLTQAEWLRRRRAQQQAAAGTPPPPASAPQTP